MEKKKLNLATIESAIKNEAMTINGKDEKELASLIIVDRINHEKKESEHQSFLHGDTNVIAAAIALRMCEVEGFSDMIYKAVLAYEKNMKSKAEKVEKVEKAFKDIDDALGTLINNLGTLLGEKPSGKKRMHKQ